MLQRGRLYQVLCNQSVSLTTLLRVTYKHDKGNPQRIQVHQVWTGLPGGKVKSALAVERTGLCAIYKNIPLPFKVRCRY